MRQGWRKAVCVGRDRTGKKPVDESVWQRKIYAYSFCHPDVANKQFVKRLFKAMTKDPNSGELKTEIALISYK